jgi:F0F1-type ATP synthase assembly protein I
MKAQPNDGGDSPRERARLLALGYSISSMLLGPVLMGWLLDYILGSLPWLTIVGTFLGMLLLFVQLIRFTQPRKPEEK